MSYNELQTRLGYSFKNIELLKLALIHKSYSNTTNNERLEFLGDSILNTVISQYLFLKFSNEKEGLLTRMRAYLVKAETLTMKAGELRLTDPAFATPWGPVLWLARLAMPVGGLLLLLQGFPELFRAFHKMGKEREAIFVKLLVPYFIIVCAIVISVFYPNSLPLTD